MQAAAQTYSQINFSALETKTRKYNDAGSYLIATASLYIFISFLFRMKVYPTIETIFSNADITPSTNFIWLMANWELITGITTGFLFLCFAFSYPIKHIRDFSSDISDKLLYKIFLPSSIRTSYSNILDILRFPLGSTGGTSASPYIASLTDAAKHSQNSLCEEINILLTLEVKKLEKQCDRLNKAILSMAAIVIVLSICLFLQTTYSTIFLLGNIV
ncbi:hypothetical protein [Parendozoicomonas haliclonae]|nr:hypothetical protein [Parendozoicomonas haliclonae]